VWRICSAPGVVTLVRHWTDDSADTVLILSEATALARRDGHAERLVWTCEGPVLEVVNAVLALPVPCNRTHRPHRCPTASTN
jgi:hypothetical protein